jgi:hypothetical protein
MRISGLLLMFSRSAPAGDAPDGHRRRADQLRIRRRSAGEPVLAHVGLDAVDAALIHGINGLRNITLDYVTRPDWRLAINMTSYVIGSRCWSSARSSS